MHLSAAAHGVDEKRGPDAETQLETQLSGLGTGDLARDGLTATDRYGEALVKFDPQVEARLRRKIDLAVVPLAAIIFLFFFIDKANIGNARLAGLEKDLGMAGADFNSVNSIYYVGYIIFEFPANFLCKIMGPGWYLPAATLAFGLTSIGSAYVQNYAQLAGVRFLLGVFEASVMPSTAYYVLSRWYRRSELTFRISLYVVMAPLAGAFGGLLASGILNSRGFAGIPSGSWRLIFLIEGIITIVLSIISFFLLTDRPETARWLSQDEKDLAIARLKSERIVVTTILDKADLAKLWRGMANPVTAITGLCFLFETVTSQGLAIFCPTIVKSIFPSASVTTQQLYTVPPYLLSAICMLTMCYVSWKMDSRSLFIVFSAPMVLIGYIIFLATTNPTARYVALFFIASTCFNPGALTLAQVSANVVSDSARNMAIATNMFGANLGSMISIWTFLSWDAPTYYLAGGLNIGTSTAWLIAGLGIHMWMKRDNLKRSRRDVDSELAGLSEQQISDLDWKHPAFRWKP